RSRRRFVHRDPRSGPGLAQQVDRRQGPGGPAADDGDVVVAVHPPIVPGETVPAPAQRKSPPGGGLSPEQEAIKSGRERPLLASPALRTVRATFTAHGSG